MVEGLTRVVTRERAAMKILDSSYDYYVRAYRALAAVLDIDVEQLWRALWAYPVGQVRSAFGPVVDRVCRQASRGALTPAERLRLQGLADRMFDASRNAIAESDQRMLMRTWGAVLG